MRALLRLLTLSLAALTAAWPTLAQPRHFLEEGIPSTGFNRLMGVPIWQFPNLEGFIDELGEEVVFAGFETLGAFDAVLGEGQGNSIPMTPDLPGTTILATHFDELSLPLLGVTREAVPDHLLNVRFDNVGVLVDDHGVTRADIPCATDTDDPTVITRAAPCDEDLTLETWLAAEGKMRIKCEDDGTASLEMKMSGLVPNRMYSVWYVQENVAAGPEKLISPVPFGGVPNAFITTDDGRGRFDRTLGFCPHEVEQALAVAVHLRSDGQNHGGVPVPFLNQEDPATAFDGYVGLIPGTTVNVQLNFNIHGEPAELAPAARPAHAAGEPVRLSAYPNPFNPVTQFTLRLPEAGDVAVAVYDLLGRRVATLQEGALAAGTHRFTFRGEGLASGVYLIRAVGPTFALTRPVTLTK